MSHSRLIGDIKRVTDFPNFDLSVGLIKIVCVKKQSLSRLRRQLRHAKHVLHKGSLTKKVRNSI